MAKVLALLLVGLLFHVAVSDPQVQCDNPTADTCEETGMIETLSSQANFPSAYFLNAHCRNFNRTVSCIVDEAQQCPNSRNKEMLDEYVEIQRIVQEICQEGSTFRQSYLDSVPCFNSILDKLANCSKTIKEEVEKFKLSDVGVVRPVGLNSPFKYQCIKMYTVPNCQIRETAEKCNLNAASVLKDITYGVSNMMIKTLCNEDSLAVWLDEFRTHVLESRPPQTVEICVTQTVATQSTAILTNVADVIGTSAEEDKPTIRDAIIGLIKSTKEKVPKKSST